MTTIPEQRPPSTSYTKTIPPKEKEESVECLLNTFETFWNERNIEICTDLFTLIAPKMDQMQQIPPLTTQKFWKVLQIMKQKAFNSTSQQEAISTEKEFVRKLLHSTGIITDSDLEKHREFLLKWTRANLPIEIYLANPEEAKLLMKRHLHHQISCYGHEIKIGPDNHLEILSANKYTPVKELLADLEQGTVCLISKKDGKEWVYLPSGLTEWQTTGWTELRPIARLSDEQLAVTSKRAKELPSPLMSTSERQGYVLQIVSSWGDPLLQNYFGLSGVDETTIQPQHPWLRLITPEGDLYSIGFNWQKSIGLSNLAETTESRLRSPDLNETVPFNGRIVTNIAIDEKQFQLIKNDLEKDQGTAFNFITQNCSAYVSHILKNVGFEAAFYVNLNELFWRIIPSPVKNFVRTIRKPCRKITKAVKYTMKMITPPIIALLMKKTAKIAHTGLNALMNASTNFVLFLIGGRKGVKAPEVTKGFIDPDTNRFPPLQGSETVRLVETKKFFSKTATEKIYLPRKVIEWQMQQKSTTHLDGRSHRRFYHQFDPITHQNSV